MDPLREFFPVTDEILDLFGEPVLPDREPGRPAFEWTPEKSNRVKVLFACGYDPGEIAPVMGCCIKTFRKVFSLECRDRRNAKLKLRSNMMVNLAKQAMEGSVSAAKALDAMIEREGIRAMGGRIAERGKGKPEPKAPALGKKEQAKVDAAAAGGRFGTRPAPERLVN